MSELLAGLSSQAPFLQQSQEALMRVTTFTKSNDLRSPRSPRSPRPMTPLPCNDTAVERSRKQIDQEVLRLEDHIRSLKSQRNFLAPISNLPPEMLAKIFAYRVWDESGGAISRLDWIKVTHVSRHWRSVAFDTPSLWSNIPFTHPRWAEEMLKRSKSAGLTIKANVGMTTPRMRDILELALRQGARIHHLDLNGGYGVIAKVLSDLEFEAPMLQSLVLSGPRNYEADVIIVPEKVLQCEMPYLRLAEFTRCKIHWETQTLSNLHKLKLQDISEHCRPSTEQLVELLSRMPDLQILDLTDALPTVTTAPAPSDVDRVIDLPRLTSLVLSGKMQACLNLLRHITVPATATLQLACTTESIADKDFAGIIQFISTQQRSKGAKYIRSLLLQDVGYNGLCLQTSPKASPLASYVARDQQYPSGAIQLKLYWGTSFLNASTREDLALTIFRALPLAHLRFLNLSGGAQMQTGHWTEIFGLLPKLHNIHIRGLSARAFLTAMIAERSDDLTPTSPTPRSSDLLSVRRPGLRRRKSAVPAVFFPGLRKLSLEDIDFESSIGGRDFLEVLQDSLMERCERKAEVRTLALNDCTRLDDYGVGLLEEIVTDVDWDGCVMGYSDEEEDEDEEDFYHGGWDYDDYDDYSDDYGGMFF